MSTPPFTPADLRERAERYREMINTVSDQRLIDALREIADASEALANEIEKSSSGRSA